MKKVLKGISLLLIVALITGLLSMGNTDQLSVLAAGYDPVTISAGEETPAVVAKWRFADGLNASGTASPVAGVDYTYKFSSGFKGYDGEEYDLYIQFTPIDPKNTTDAKIEASDPGSYGFEHPAWTPLTAPSVKSATSNAPEDNSRSIKYVELIYMDSSKNKAFEYKIWVSAKDDATSTPVDVPFIIGPCYMGNNGTSFERLRIYSYDNKIITNINKEGFIFNHENFKTRDGELFNGWTPKNGYDNVGYYMLGLGYEGNTQKGAFSTSNGGRGALEMRVGYQAYSITYTLAPGSEEVNVKAETPKPGVYSLPETTLTATKDAFDDVYINQEPNKPTITPKNPGHTVSYIRIKDIGDGETEPLKYDDGTLVKVGDLVDGAKLAGIKMNHHLTVEIMAVAPGTEYSLEYDYAVGTHDAIIPNATNPNPVKKYDYAPGAVSKAQTDAKYQRGAVVTGSDSKQYVFQGWYYNPSDLSNPGTDPDATELVEFVPGTNHVLGNTKVIGKWADSITVKFNMNGKPGTAPADQTIGKGTAPATSPSASTSGYTFKGWSTTSGGTTPVDIIAINLTADVTTYYAIWEKTSGGSGGGYIPPSTIPEKKYKVEFETPYGPKPDAQSGIKSGGTVSDPINTLKPGYTTEDGHTFEGWYLDEAHTIPYDFNSGITKDIVLYAKWTATETNNVPTETPNAPVVKVEFETEIGETPATQVEVPGNTATDPGAPMDLATLKPGTIINGYRFEGWYLDKDYTIKYDFGTPLTEDIVLYAKWASVGVAKSPKTEDAALPLGVGMASALLLALSLFALSGKRRKDVK